jgi:hypothetical protein
MHAPGQTVRAFWAKGELGQTVCMPRARTYAALGMAAAALAAEPAVMLERGGMATNQALSQSQPAGDTCRSLAQCTVTVSGYLRDKGKIKLIGSLGRAKLIEAMQIDDARKIVEAMQNVHGDEVAQGLHTGS